MSNKLLLAASAVAILTASPAFAADDVNLQSLQAEIQAMRDAYESKIDQLEKKVETLSSQQSQTAARVAATEPAAGGTLRPATSGRSASDNSFNPEISVILEGNYNAFSNSSSEFAGFAVGEEAERSEEGFGIDETELTFSANIDNLFRGSTTIALAQHDGEVEVELEEAYVETIALPYGLNAKVGRFFSELGYLNSHHTHTDDFSDRPLTNRAFLDENYGDDGVQVSAVLPTDFYSEVGGGVYRGGDFPGGEAEGSSIGSWTAYGRVGGDIGDDTSWRLGLSTLQVNDTERGEEVIFDGDSDLYIADARLTYAPTGNAKEKEIILQGEYFYRDEDGSYEDTDAGTGAVAFDDGQSGWYAQGVYKFHPQWRTGVRYSQLYAGDTPAGLVGSALDSEGHDPWSASAMIDWSNSEFSRVRAQFNHEELADGEKDNQILLQYIMSIGAHGAHPF